MGVSGMRGVLDQVNLSTNVVLKNKNLVVDVTENMYWFFKKRDVAQKRMDRFGTNLVEFCNSFRQFIINLKQNNVTPIFVFSGARLSKHYFSDIATKDRHLEKSTRIKMLVRGRYGSRDWVPTPLLTNALKKVINEFTDLPKPIQAQYEVHPILQQQANRLIIPVLTSHSEFILKNIREGFVLGEKFNYPTVQSRGFNIELYQHRLLLEHYRLQSCSDALHSLFSLLRPDVSGRYNTYINDLLYLQRASLEISHDETRFVRGRPGNRPGNLTRRCKWILENWPENLRTADQVRDRLMQVSSNDRQFLQDHDAIQMTFKEPKNFAEEILVNDQFVPRQARTNTQIRKVNEALTSRSATATFLMEVLMAQTNYDHAICLEDFSTFRSSYSLADGARAFIMKQFGIREITILDRSSGDVDFRQLSASESGANGQSVYAEDIYKLFHFHTSLCGNQSISAYIADFQVKLALLGNLPEQLVIILLLLRYCFQVGFRTSYNNEPDVKAKTKPESPKEKLSGYPISMDYEEKGLRLVANAVYNVFMYYMMENEGAGSLNMEKLNNDPRLCDDSKGINFLPDLRLARGKMDSTALPNPSEAELNYTKIKHVLEMLNSTIQAYDELNSLYEHKAIDLKYHKYYEPPLIYRVAVKLSKTKGEGLLRMEQNLENLICS